MFGLCLTGIRFWISQSSTHVVFRLGIFQMNFQASQSNKFTIITTFDTSVMPKARPSSPQIADINKSLAVKKDVCNSQTLLIVRTP